MRFWPPDVTILDEHVLAPRLLQVALPYWPWMLRAAGSEETATELDRILADLADANGRLSDINQGHRPIPHAPRDARHQRARGHRPATTRITAAARGSEDEDDLHAQCIMAAFAGRMSAHAASLVGVHVFDDVYAELKTLTSLAAPHVRRPAGEDLRRARRAGAGRRSDQAPEEVASGPAADAGGERSRHRAGDDGAASRASQGARSRRRNARPVSPEAS